MTALRLSASFVRLQQLASYGAVSVAALCVDVATLVGAKERFGASYAVAAAVGLAAGTVVHYALAKAIVFEDSKLGAKGAEFLIYALLGIVATGLSLGAIIVFTEWGGLDYRLSKALSVVLSFFAGYGLRKAVLYR